MNKSTAKLYGYKIKSARLDEDSWVIADSINFSRWAREELKAWDRRQSDKHVQTTGMGFHRLCNPYHKDGLCEKCWPIGIPTKESWLEYLKASREGLEPDAPKIVPREDRASPYQGKKTGLFGKKSGAKETNGNANQKWFAAVGWLVALIAILV